MSASGIARDSRFRRSAASSMAGGTTRNCTPASRSSCRLAALAEARTRGGASGGKGRPAVVDIEQAFQGFADMEQV